MPRSLAALVLLPALASAHPGGLDSQGGHTDRSTGIYHYHRTVVIPAPPPTPPALPRAVAAFDACRSGPAVPGRAGCAWYDLDEDGDVDHDDFGALQRGDTWPARWRALEGRISRLENDAVWIWPRHTERLTVGGTAVTISVDPQASGVEAQKIIGILTSQVAP